MELVRSTDIESQRWFVLDINPEPWAVGPLDLGRRNGKVYATMGQNQQLAAFQEAVREEIGEGHEVWEGAVKLTIYFWRNRADYRTAHDRIVRKNDADATNMGKATEDALQGLLFVNDRQNNDVRYVIVEQGPEVKGKIAICVEPSHVPFNLEIPRIVGEQIDALDDKIETTTEDRNAWPPKDTRDIGSRMGHPGGHYG